MEAKNYRKEIDRLNEIIAEQQDKLTTLNKLFSAYDKVEQLTTQELLDAEKRVKTQERISDFSVKELKQRDISLNNVLEINKKISSILNEKKLLTKILDGLVTSLKAHRGIMYVAKDGKLIPTLFKNFEKKELKEEYFVFCEIHIERTGKKKTSLFKLFQEIQNKDEIITLSFVCLPLIYQNKLLGVIYVDIISEIKSFRIQDLDIAEIFSSQAAISMNNAITYQKIKGQNLELMKLINIKDQLFTDLSKKIKKPLRAIYRKLDQVIKKDELSKEQRIEYIESVFSEIEGMWTTVEKVLTMQQMEKQADELFIDNVDFNETFDFLIDYYRNAIEEKDISIHINLSDDFRNYHGNKSVMRTIFDELFSNAVFYNKEGGNVAITGYKDGDYLIIEIADTGHGIKGKDLKHIFEQFYRTADSPELNDKGAGLGLYLAQKFVKYYNGSIHAKSEYGEGATFTVKFMIN